MISVRELDASLDLWLCMWQPDERERFETALVRAMTDAHPRPTRKLALAAAHVIATPRLLNAAARVADSQLFDTDEIRRIEEGTLGRHRLLADAERMRGNVQGVELLLARYCEKPADLASDALLDWIDVRDLVAVARTTLDGRLYREVERRVARRGRYQRARIHNVLGFTVRANRAGHSPKIGEQARV